MSWVIAFFFSGRRSRDHPHRVFVGDYQVLRHAMVLANRAARALASLFVTAYIIWRRRPNRRYRFSTVTQ